MQVALEFFFSINSYFSCKITTAICDNGIEIYTDIFTMFRRRNYLINCAKILRYCFKTKDSFETQIRMCPA